MSIFLRELRGVWQKADPRLTEIELLAARQLGFTAARDPRRALDDLKELWRTKAVRGYDFRHLEAALVRTGLDLRRSGDSAAQARRRATGAQHGRRALVGPNVSNVAPAARVAKVSALRGGG